MAGESQKKEIGMSQPFADLSLILKEFAVTTVEELFQKRTNGRQVRAIDVSEPPKLVSITSDKCKELCDKAGLQYEPGYYKRVIARTTTTEKPDRYGDIVRASGVNIDNYRRNPVVLFAHEHSQPPVGNSIKIWQDVNQKAWKSFDLYFDDKVDTTGRSDLVFRMVSSGAMPGGSIGFLPKQCKNDHTKKERESFGMGEYGVEYLSCDYLEHSACSVPANPECLLNTLKAIELGKFFAKPDLDKMEQLKLFNVELIDVFANSLGVKRTVSLPPAAAEEAPPASEENRAADTPPPPPPKEDDDEDEGNEPPEQQVIKIEGLDTVIDLLRQLVEQGLSNKASPEGKPSGEQDAKGSKGLKLHKLIDMTPKIF